MTNKLITISLLLTLSACQSQKPKKTSALDGIIERLETSKKKQCFYKLDSTGLIHQGAYCLDFWKQETSTKKQDAKKQSK